MRAGADAATIAALTEQLGAVQGENASMHSILASIDARNDETSTILDSEVLSALRDILKLHPKQ